MFRYFLRDGRHPFGDSNMSLRTLQNIAAGKPEETIRLADNRKLETIAEGERELGSQVAGEPEEAPRLEEGQKRQNSHDNDENKNRMREQTQLQNAIREMGDSLETIEPLLAQGADVEEKDESRPSVLQYVVENPS